MTLALKGDALGSGGSATMNLRSGLNLVGVPLQTGILPTLSAAINHPVFAGITHIVIMDENGQFQNVLPGTDTDGPLMGGTGYFVIASEAFSVAGIWCCVGERWRRQRQQRCSGRTQRVNNHLGTACAG